MSVRGLESDLEDLYRRRHGAFQVMLAVGQGTVRRMTQFPVPLLRTNVKPARSKRVRVPL